MAAKHPAAEAIEKADLADAARRRDKPTREELTQALRNHAETETDREHIMAILEGRAQPPGAHKQSENAKLARDILIFTDYLKQRGKGLEKVDAEKATARKFRVKVSAVRTAKTLGKALFFKR